MPNECGAIDGLMTAGETEVLTENLSRCHFVHRKFHVASPGIEPWLPQWEASV